jgi:hypothetical protein
VTESETKRPRGSSTICLPFRQDNYNDIVGDPTKFRAALDQAYADMPELFPKAFADGYFLKDSRCSAKLGLRLRRVECYSTHEAFTIRPSFVMPYLTELTKEAEKVLLCHSYGMPFHAIARLFGKDAMHWYRLEVSLGRNSIVGTTIRRANIPEHLCGDEHHQTLDGEKSYVATTVAEGLCLGAALSTTADEAGLEKAYRFFALEAENVSQQYKPQTVNVDGWAATQAAWQALYPMVVLLRCFLHGWINIRDRSKNLKGMFKTIGDKVWNAYRAVDKRTFRQRLRRLREWATGHLTGVVLEQVEKLCNRGHEYALAYDHQGGHRTSNMLDRVMRDMNRYFEDGQHLHGSHEAADLHCRAWALLYNFGPWSAATAKANDGFMSPAERHNRFSYDPDWLENLLISASTAGFRR